MLLLDLEILLVGLAIFGIVSLGQIQLAHLIITKPFTSTSKLSYCYPLHVYLFLSLPEARRLRDERTPALAFVARLRVQLLL